MIFSQISKLLDNKTVTVAGLALCPSYCVCVCICVRVCVCVYVCVHVTASREYVHYQPAAEAHYRDEEKKEEMIRLTKLKTNTVSC